MSKHAKSATPVEEPGFFSDLEPAEHRTCRNYLFSQEIVREEKIVRRTLETNQKSALRKPRRGEKVVTRLPTSFWSHDPEKRK